MFSADKYRLEADPKSTPQEQESSRVISISSPGQESSNLIGEEILSVALIGPDEQMRHAAGLVLAGCGNCEIREFESYPPNLDEVPRLLEQNCDVIIIDLDSDPEYAFELLERVGVMGTATVMVYSSRQNPELLMRCMRAGAREFLSVPFSHTMVAEALVRASARRPMIRPQKKAGGKLMVFMGSKGGSGVTMMACNFAVSLAKESGESTLLIDLDLPLGDAALNLGIAAEYSTINALQDWQRLDQSLLARLLVKHSSGVSVLAAPGKFPGYNPPPEAIDRLVQVARAGYDNVVVDVGSRLDLTGTALYKDAYTIYLVTQSGIPELRNSNRLIGQFFSSGGPKLEIVINRYEAKQMGVTDEHITKALTRPAEWKVPNDYAAVRKMQNTATPLALGDSALSRQIRQMAKSVNPPQEEEEPVRKKVFGIFG